MNTAKLKQLNIIVIMAVIIGLIFMALFVFVFSPDGQNKITGDSIKDYSENWILKGFKGGTDELVDLPHNIDADAEEIIVLLKALPDDINANSALAFKTEFQNVRVLLGDNNIYMNGVMNDQKLMKNAVPGYNIIDLSDAAPGDMITIYLSSAYKKYSGDLPEIYYGTKSDIIFNIINNNAVSMVLAIALMATALLLAISLIIMKNKEVDKRKALYAFGLIFATALWSFLSNPIMQLLTKNLFGIYMCSMVVLLLIPVIYIMYQRCFAIKRRYARMFEIGIYIYGINFLTGVIFQIFSVCDFASYLSITKLLIIIGLFLLSGLMYLAADAYKDGMIRSNLIANTILLVSAVVEGILSFFKFYKRYDGLVLDIGLYIFLVMLVIIVQRDIINEVNQKKEEAIENLGQKKESIIKDINTKLVFKALNEALNSLKEDKENSRLIYNTSVYLKDNMRAATHEGLVPFKEELVYIKAYLEMEKRINHGLEVEIEDKVDSFRVPYGSIEALVENAVRNGALKSTSTPRIIIRIYERLDCYAIQIVDNGKGIGPDKRFDGTATYKDIKKRLKTLCKAGVEIRNKEGKGTIITIKLPKEGYIIKED